jgi:hypothetical protein
MIKVALKREREREEREREKEERDPRSKILARTL